MSTYHVPVLVCDGCGTQIDMDFYIRIQPTDQKVIQRNPEESPERDFCCEACQSWWQAEFPADGPWGPAWYERDWWFERVQAGKERAHIRTAHDQMPIVDTHAHFDDPETIK